jgi:hypothetical protein
MFSSPPTITATLHDDAAFSACRRRRAPLLSPTLIKALTELAAIEELSVSALIAVLINEALDRRLQRCRS